MATCGLVVLWISVLVPGSSNWSKDYPRNTFESLKACQSASEFWQNPDKDGTKYLAICLPSGVSPR